MPVKPLNTVYDIKKTDAIIISNLFFQIFICTLLSIIFIFIRKQYVKYYSPNIYQRPNHICYNNFSILTALKQTFFTKDIDLLSYIGLDMFMFLKLLKNTAYLFLFLFASLGIFLTTIYYFTNVNPNNNNISLKTTMFSQMSKYTQNINTNQNENISSSKAFHYKYTPLTLYASLFFMYYLTLIVLYFIYIQSKKFLPLCSIYNSNPYTMISSLVLKNKLFGDIYHQKHKIRTGQDDNTINTRKKMKEYNNTFLLYNIPKNLASDSSLKKYLKNLKPKKCIYIYQIERLEELISELKKRTLIFENNLQELFDVVKTEIESKKMLNLEDKDIEKNYYNDNTKRNLISKFISTNKEYQNRLHIDLEDDYNNLHASYKELLIYLIQSNDINKAINNNDKENDIFSIYNNIIETFENIEDDKQIEFFYKNSNNYIRHRLITDIIHLKKNHIGFISLKEDGNNRISNNNLYLSKIFNLKVKKAPILYDINYNILYTNTKLRYLVFLTILIFYGLIIFGLINFLMMYINEYIFIKYLEHIENSYSGNKKLIKKIKNILESIITPMIFNIILTISPYFIYIIYKLRRSKFKSKDQNELTVTNIYFILYATFIGSFVGRHLLEKIFTVVKSKELSLNVIFQNISNDMYFVFVMLFNLLVQRMLFGSLNVLMKYYLIPKSFYKRDYTRRDKRNNLLSSDIDFYAIFSSVFLGFHIVLFFSIIAPIFLILGFFYFIIYYFVYKHELIFALVNKNETGGKYFLGFINYIAFSLVTMHVVYMGFILTNFSNVIPVLSLPLIFITFYFTRNITNNFKNSLNNTYNINEHENLLHRNISDSFMNKNLAIIKELDKTKYQEFYFDSIYIYDLFIDDCNIDKEVFTNDYKFEYDFYRYKCIYLPKNFYQYIEAME